jgi:hypothetical protein
MKNLCVTVSGSFHKHIRAIKEAVGDFTEMKIQVLSPADPRVVDSVGQFLFVASDKHRSIRLVQDRHLSAIVYSDFLWLVAPDGYIGQSASLELGFAIAYGIPIFSEVIPPDLTLQQYVKQVKNAKEAKEIIEYTYNKLQDETTRTGLLLDPHIAIELAHRKLDIIDELLGNPERVLIDTLDNRIINESNDIRTLLKIPSNK